MLVPLGLALLKFDFGNLAAPFLACAIVQPLFTQVVARFARGHFLVPSVGLATLILAELASVGLTFGKLYLDIESYIYILEIIVSMNPMIASNLILIKQFYRGRFKLHTGKKESCTPELIGLGLMVVISPFVFISCKKKKV